MCLLDYKLKMQLSGQVLIVSKYFPSLVVTNEDAILYFV